MFWRNPGVTLQEIKVVRAASSFELGELQCCMKSVFYLLLIFVDLWFNNPALVCGGFVTAFLADSFKIQNSK